MANKLRIIPLGGLGEVGKNMMVLEYGKNIIIIDAGIMFPENDMLGVDFIIPDFNYLADKKDMVRGIIITHGHEDHVGGLPYLLQEIKAPIYTTRLTRGLAEVKLKENRLLDEAELNTIQAGDSIALGPFRIEFFHVCHSIPDGVGLAIETPVGLVVHSGDFKFDYTPVDGKPPDFAKLAELGGRGVLVLMSDSTNAEQPGATSSERAIDDAFDKVFQRAEGRIIVGTFASLISRIQQVVNAAVRHERKVAIAGYSMVENVRMAQELGYLSIPPGVLIKLGDVDKLPQHKVVIIATGTQGEPSSALARMSFGRHRQIRVVRGDTIVISAHAIPGNEEMISRTINRLLQQGANVMYEQIAPVHVSGHASQDEQRLLIHLIKPRYFVPIHGELRHLTMHARIAQEMGVPAANTMVVENGYILEFDGESGRISERVPGGYVFVDGSGVGDIGPVVMRDREILASAGFVVAVIKLDEKTGQPAGRPEIISRGFVYVRDSAELLEQAQDKILEVIEKSDGGRAAISDKVREELSKLLYDETKRRPMILPVILEV
ncbi:MAG: ribonuclease J [Anaerolineales bacterium]|nr:ribonuclease J [Anaerolineales bacterium]